MPACTICGRDVEFIPQYQQWYCRSCGTYPYLQQAYAPQPAYQQAAPQWSAGNPPVIAPTLASARSRMHSSIAMRAGSDARISSAWVAAIVALQIIFPVMAVAAVYWLVLGTYEFDDPLMLALIAAAVVMAMALVVLHGMLVYKLVARRDAHFRRDAILRVGMEEYLSALSLDKKVDVNVERWTMATISQGSADYERSPLTWAMLVSLIAIIPLVGVILLLYCQAFLTRDLQDHEDRQRAHLNLFHQGLLKTGRAGQPLYDWRPLPRRDIAAYVIMSILTVGFFLPYWWYVNIRDMNDHFTAQWGFEDSLLRMLQADG